MRTFGHVQTPPPPLYAFVCISVDPPTPLDAYVINGRPHIYYTSSFNNRLIPFLIQ